MFLDELDELDPVEVSDPSTEERPYGIIVFGATGYSGRLIVEHLDALIAKGAQVRWAIAGRSKAKLRQIARKCSSSPDVFEASEPSEISLMLADCRVVINAAGPYQLCGEDVVRECVNRVTHYVDISGETVWIRSMIDKYHAKAKERGVMIVHLAGNVAVPDEVCCYLLVQRLGPLKEYREYVSQYGYMSGGTSNTNMVTMQSMTAESFALSRDPFLLGGARADGPRDCDKDMVEVSVDPHFPAVWLAPAYGTAVGSRTIRRTAALFEERPGDSIAYGKDISVSIFAGFPKRVMAENQMNGVRPPADLEASLYVGGKMREALDAGQVPQPGQGAPAATRAIAFAEVFGVAQGESGKWAHVHYKAGEGYEVTAMAAVASAMVLYEELDRLRPRERGGVLTPGYAFHGSTWLDRLTGEAFAAKPDGRKIGFEVKDGMPREEELLQSAAGVNKAMLEGQAKVMKGQLKQWC